MRTEFKNKSMLGLLALTAVLDTLSVFLFLFMDRIVNVDLYHYGLISNSEWLTPYQLYSQLTLGLMVASVASVVMSLILVQRFKNKQSMSIKASIYLLIAFSVIATILSVVFLTRMNYMVNTTLYNYGLRYSNEWSSYYGLELQLCLGLTACSIVAAIISETIFFSGTQPPGRIRLTKLVSPSMIMAGVVALVFSIIYASQIPAFIGLGLIFWGIIVKYIATEEYVKQSILNATVLTPLTIMNENIRGLNFEGKAVYLPPQYLTEIESNKACITKKQNDKLPTPEETQFENNSVIRYPEWFLLTPPGNELAKLFEKTLKTSFTKTNLSYIEQNLPRLLIEELEIAETLQIQTAKNMFKIILENTVYADICRQIPAPNSLGCPVSSAIACALAKSSGNPVMIHSEQVLNQEKTITIEYEILEPQKEKPEQ